MKTPFVFVRPIALNSLDSLESVPLRPKVPVSAPVLVCLNPACRKHTLAAWVRLHPQMEDETGKPIPDVVPPAMAWRHVDGSQLQIERPDAKRLTERSGALCAVCEGARRVCVMVSGEAI